jgi:catechol 2,3-dioxygenase-like lactoylglutathione lyase family enzyme
MIDGVHAVLFSRDAEALRAFFRDVLELPSVDAGGGWPIFGLPPAEVAAHPADAPGAELYLMCNDLEATMAALSAKGIELGPVTEQGWGRVTTIALPGGGELGLYEPRHPRPPDA